MQVSVKTKYSTKENVIIKVDGEIRKATIFGIQVTIGVANEPRTSYWLEDEKERRYLLKEDEIYTSFKILQEIMGWVEKED